MVRTRSVAVNTSDVALATEPECLGPCEPGTSVNLEGIVWQETEDGKSSGLTRSLLNVFPVKHMTPAVLAEKENKQTYGKVCVGFYLHSAVALRHQWGIGLLSS